MPSELNRRAVFAAAAAFLLALTVAYALGSTGQASEGTGVPGSPAAPLDVASGVAGQSGLGEAAALPALRERPKPPPPEPEPDEEEVAPPPSAPVNQAPPVVAPVTPVTPVTPEPTAPEPEVEFDDSG
jgi:hypothetical protein